VKSLEPNFTILLRDRRGEVVPGSVRRGHNVFTSAGMDLMAQLICWGEVSAIADAASTQRRARYLGIGNGLQVEDKDVVSLVSAIPITDGVFLKELDSPLTVFPTTTSVCFKTVFGPSEITYADPAVEVSEAGLYFDSSPDGVLSVSSPNNIPSFYKTFEPLVKLNSFSMEVTWELKF
jgi:hypothetical protein